MQGYEQTGTMLALTLFACSEGGDATQLSEVVWVHPNTGGASGVGGVAGNDGGLGAATAITGRGGGGRGGLGANEPSGGAGGAPEHDSCVSIDTSPLEATSRELYGLEINGSGFDAYEGQHVRVAIWTNPDWIAVAEQNVVGGSFKVELPLALTDYSSVGLYIDEDNNEACSEGEPTWSYTSGAGACTAQPCPPPGGTHVENIRLPLAECADCGPWRPHPLAQLGDEYCATGTGNDLADVLACPT